MSEFPQVEELVFLGLLTFTQITIAIMARVKRHQDFTEIFIRTRSWWFMLMIIEGALFLGKNVFLGFIACLSFFALREYLSRVPTRVCDRKILFWLFLSIPIQFYLVHRGWLIPFLCFIPLYGISVIAIRLLLTGVYKGFVLAFATFQVGLLTTVYSTSHIAYLVFLNKTQGYEIEVGSFLFFVSVTQANDVFQFLSGKTFGKNKIAPQISPKKTIEGFLGGVILSSLVSAFLAPQVMPFTWYQGLLAGALLSVFGFFGDILMSAIKRDLEIKDFSQIIPGHGGVLDRVDSLIISAPLYFHLIRVLSHS